jgi:hypothetical protein
MAINSGVLRRGKVEWAAHRCSRFVTAFQFQGRKLVFNRIPFGLSLSPYFMQRFISLLVRLLRPLVDFVWGHIDDVLIVAEAQGRI